MLTRRKVPIALLLVTFACLIYFWTSSAMQHKYIEGSRSGSSLKDLYPSEATMDDFDSIMKAQRHTIREYCSNHRELSGRRTSYSNLLYNDQYKVIFCFIPKVGCSNYKYMFHVMMGYMPANKSLMKFNVHNNPQIHKLMFQRLSPAEQQRRLHDPDYIKFVVLRDPAERMLSGFMDKLEFAIPDRHGNPIYHSGSSSEQRYRVKISNEMANQIGRHHGERPQSVDKGYIMFADYLDYLTWQPLRSINPHFSPQSWQCNPCAIDFSYFINFNSINKDTFRVLDRRGIPRWMYSTQTKHKSSSVTIKDWMNVYYGQMSSEDRRFLMDELLNKTGHTFPALDEEGISRDLLFQVFHRYVTDFDLYYSLFPKETRMDKYFLYGH